LQNKDPTSEKRFPPSMGGSLPDPEILKTDTEMTATHIRVCGQKKNYVLAKKKPT